MLTAIEILYYLLRTWGIWDKLLAVHHAKEKAQAVANAPETDGELKDALEHGEV